MPTPIKMPALSPTMEEGTLAKWLVKPGDKVEAGDIMAEIETDKATMEFEAVDEGTIAKILVEEGTDEVKVGSVIALLAEEGEDVEEVAKGGGSAKSGGETKADAERQQLAILADYQPDLIILARYMQVLTGDFLAKCCCPVINIHHSSLPAFAGAKPYHQAYQRGVKIIGATAHYVTKDLDAGPIIHQDFVRISHRRSVQEMIRNGRDLEKFVLACAVRCHLENRVLVYGNKTIVFD